MRMRNSIIVLIFALFFLESCSTMHFAIRRNNNLTSRQVSHLYKENGNAFYLSSTYSSFSVVWTYDEDRIEIYRIKKGRIKEKQVYCGKEMISFSGVDIKDIENAIYQNFALELDGDAFGFIIRIGSETCKENFAIDINSLKQRHEYPAFLERVINDIRVYKMWEIQYQQQN